MAILMNDNVSTAAPKPTDDRYGPYNTINEATTAITSASRFIGLTVGILENGGVTEYWFGSGTANANLVVKSGSGGGGGGGGPYILGDNTIVKMVKMTEADYINLQPKDPATLYVIIP